jgi:hypothetical protein
VLIGVLLGLAVGCKLTAGFFFAMPVAAVLLVRAVSHAGAAKAVATAAVVAAAVYAPWAVRAAAASGGNPVFPFAANQLGRDGWTPAQVERFDRGHRPPAADRPLGRRLASLADNSVFDPQWSPSWRSIYSWTHTAPPDEAAWRRFGWLWLVVPLGVGLALVQGARGGARAGGGRGAAGLLLLVLAIQVAAWLFLTHLQARFLLPVAVPLALLLGIGVQGIGDRTRRGWGGAAMDAVRVLTATGVCVHAACAVFLLLPEAGLLGGTAHPDNAPAPAQPIGVFAPKLNLAGIARLAQRPGAQDADQVPPETSLLVGTATAWRYAGGPGQVVYNTVFDHNLLGDALRDGGPAGAVAMLRRRGIRFILIQWPEVERLRRTYGYDEAITPDAVAGLKAAGLAEIPLQGADGMTLLQVPGQ